LPVTVLDTAGLRETQDLVESIGVGRAIARARAADLRVFLLGEGEIEGLVPLPGDIVVQGKADLGVSTSGSAVSGVTSQGIAELIEQIAISLENRASGAATATHERHRQAIQRAIGAMESARDEVRGGSARTELAAEEVRVAIQALESLVGRVDVEHLLGEIFASFCIGK
jgi:tRNA modification GTPase